VDLFEEKVKLIYKNNVKQPTQYNSNMQFLTIFVLILSLTNAFNRPSAKRTYTQNMKDIIRKIPFSGVCGSSSGGDSDDELFANAGANMPEPPPEFESEYSAEEAAKEAAEDAAQDEEYIRKGFDEATRKKLKTLAQTFRRKIKQTYRGYDLRPSDKSKVVNDLTTDEIVFDYVESFRKKDLLDKLQDPNIPNVEKLRLLNEKRFLYDEF